MPEKVIIDLEPQVKDSLKIASQIEAKEKSILGLVKERVAAAAKGIATGARGALSGVGGAAAGVGGAISKAVGGKGLSAFAAMTSQGPIAGLAALGGPLAGIGAAVATITGAVSKANPAIMEQFGLAIDDFIGVMGQALAPIVEAATEIIRELGDVVATIIQIFKPLINLFVSGLKLVAKGIKIALDYFIDFYNEMIRLFPKTAKFLGLTQIEKKAGIGAAAKQAEFVSIADIASRAQQSAFSLGRSAADRTANNTERLVRLAEERRVANERKYQQQVNREGIRGF